jgi:RND superfamily putative drug exporter
MPARWTRAVLRARAGVVAAWSACLVAGVVAATQLASHLTTSFSVPGTASARAGSVLADRFGERPEGTFIVVFRVRRPSDPELRARLDRRLVRGARAVPTAHALELRSGGGILYGEIATRLSFEDAKRDTDALRRALRATGGPDAFVTGQPAIQRDLDPILAADLRRGELLAVPFALLVLLAVFGPSLAVAIPFVVAACTIAATLAVVFAAAQVVTTTTFVTNLVVLIGLGLAVDYSLLLVHRFREELRHGLASDDAIVRTMATAGRTVVFSGLTVAIALGLLFLVPVPFIRSLGTGAFLVPVFSIAAAVTLQPVLLHAIGARAFRARSDLAASVPWQRLADGVVRRRRAMLAVSIALMVALAAPLPWLRIVPASFAGLPGSTEAARGLALLRIGVAPGAITPTYVVVDAGAPHLARQKSVRRAVVRLAQELAHDHDTLLVASGTRPPYLDSSGRYARIVVVDRHDYGAPAEQAFVRRLRRRLVPGARFPHGTTVDVGGAPAQGVDFLAATYSAFPWFAFGIVCITYLALYRAFRSVLLPLTAVLLNLLTVAAAYGVLVLVFQWGAGREIEGWIPIFLFATLFGLSMDYEVFLVMRMRESWEQLQDTSRAVARGLERTGRVVSAAALIMAAAFSGFVAGRIGGLQQLGVGLTVAVLLDATVVRTLLVPSLAAVLGPRNWWRPGVRVTRIT